MIEPQSPSHPASSGATISCTATGSSRFVWKTRRSRNQEIYRGHSRGITGHATSHAPILVGPILRAEMEGWLDKVVMISIDAPV
jgi:hypothetical protein